MVGGIYVGPDQSQPTPHLREGGLEVGRGGRAAPRRVLVAFPKRKKGGEKANLAH